MSLQSLPVEVLDIIVKYLSIDAACNFTAALPCKSSGLHSIAYHHGLSPVSRKRQADGQKLVDRARLRTLSSMLDRVTNGSCTSITLLSDGSLMNDQLGAIVGALEFSRNLRSFHTNIELPYQNEVLPNLSRLEELTFRPTGAIDLRSLPLKQVVAIYGGSQQVGLNLAPGIKRVTMINAQRIMLRLNSLSKLESLYLHARNPLMVHPPKVTGVSTTLRRLVMTGNLSWRRIAHFRSTIDALTSRASNFEALSVSSQRLGEDDDVSAPSFDNIRSLESYHTSVQLFRRHNFRGLKKLVIHTDNQLSDEDFSAINASVGDCLETLVVSSLRGSAYSIFPPSFVAILIRNIALKYFSTVGHYYFTPNDWQLLCWRVFPQFRLVHIEQDRTVHGHLAMPRLHPDSADRISPVGLIPVAGGRVFVRETECHEWYGGHAWSTADIRKRVFHRCDPEHHLAISRETVVLGWDLSDGDQHVVVRQPHYENRLHVRPISPIIIE